MPFRGSCVSRTVQHSLLVALMAIGTVATIVHAQSPARPAVPGAPAGVTAFVNVAVIPMDSNRVLRDQTVLVQGGRITALGLSTKVKPPAGATKIDGQNKYLMPGLGDCHTHIGYAASNKSKPTAAVANAAAERRLFTWLADGVTTIRNMDYMEADQAATVERFMWYLNGSDLLRLRDRAAAGTLWSPRIYTSGQWAPIQYTPEHARYVAKNPAAEPPTPSLDSVIAYLKAYKAAGYDHVKDHSESEDTFDSLLVAAKKVGIDIGADLGGHRKLVGNSFLKKALAAKIRSVEHFAEYPSPATSAPEEVQKFIKATVEAGTWNCPTAAVSTSGGRRQYIRPLQDAGGGILLGTDAPFVPSVHEELQALVTYGKLTPYEALAAGTRNMAIFYHALDDVGTVTVGKRADLVLLTGNPLEDVVYAKRPAVVMIGGRWLAREEMDRRLAEYQAAGGINP